jgi:phosphoribosylanthranilate isomerase
MKAINTFMEGKKTYIGLIVALLGVLGLSRYVNPDEVEQVISAVSTLVGISLAVYGRAVAKQ